MRENYFTSVLLIVLVLNYVKSEQYSGGNCKDIKKCENCLQAPGCSWCSDNVNMTSRCSTYDDLIRRKCSTIEILPKESYTIKKGIPNGVVEPNGYEINLGVGQKINVSFSYRDGGNKPLDLYYLMDLSWTMADDKAQVAKLGKDFTNALKGRTTDLQMGFGSFVDKPLMPYATKEQIMREHGTFGFYNNLRLEEQSTNSFIRAVEGSVISINLDAPEGGLDAMMQVLECWEEIGWRNKSHRLLVLSTDGIFHIAGDGKLGGLVIPNDGKCHMDKNKYYGDSTSFDYPSVAQLVKKIREKRIYVIFAVEKSVKELYEKLSSLVSEYAITIQMDSSSSQVSKLVQDQYDKIRSSVVLNTAALAGEFLNFRHFVKCSNSKEFVEDFRCTNVSSGDKIDFITEVTMVKCPKDPNYKFSQLLAPTSSSEGLLLQIYFECSCRNCKKLKNSNPPPEEFCSNRGFKECGICNCGSMYGGETCQCSLEDNYDEESSLRCSTSCGEPIRGSCKCGQCECKEPYSGPECKCDLSLCSCRNSPNGRCDCEKCVCLNGFTGENCDCSPHKTGCLEEENSKTICSGRGDCRCNSCRDCKEGYDGKYCHICSRCNCLSEYVGCFIRRLNDTHVEEDKNRTRAECTNLMKKIEDSGDYIFKLYNQTNLKPNETQFVEEGEEKCIYTFKDECVVEYYFKKGLNSYVGVRVLNRVKCPPPPKPFDPLPIIIYTVGSVLLIGLLTLLLWKIFTHFSDKRAWEKFEKECSARKWETTTNPLYDDPNTTFHNPAFTGGTN